ncbi:MAG: hypothetical protein GY946_02815 [bacterium]|nr:hypothetical protein [bacterium]
MEFSQHKFRIMPTLICLAISLTAPGSLLASDDPDCLKVTLTGTGSPDPDGLRAKAGTLVRYGKQSNDCSEVVLQFDVGPGTLNRLERLDFDVTAVDAYFVTHSHHDHTAGLSSVIAEAWVNGLLSDVLGGTIPPQIEVPVVYVPEEPDEVVADIVIAAAEVFDEERQGRIDTIGFPPGPPFDTLADYNPDVRFLVPGSVTTVMNDGAPSAVTVSTYENGHMASVGDGVAAFSYRIETPAGTVVITGDAPPSQGLVDFAQAADIVVSEIALRPPELEGIPLFDTVFEIHLLPDDVAEIASSAGPEAILMLTHFAPSPPSTEFLGFSFAEITSCSYVDAVVDGGFDHRIIAGRDLYTVQLMAGASDLLCHGSRHCELLRLPGRAQRDRLCRKADRR